MTFLQASKLGGEAQLTYYMEQWEKINKKYFKGKLPKPKMRFLKDTGIKMSRRGQYSPMSNMFGFSRYLFNAGEDQVITILKHEIAHQAVRNLDKLSRREEIHGPNFKKWCKHLGISTKSTDEVDTLKYLDPKKQKVLLQKREEVKNKREQREKESKKMESTFKKIPVWKIADGMPAQYFSAETKSWIKGLIVMRNDQAAKRWIFITSPSSTRWLIIPSEWFHELPEKDKKEVTNSAMLAAAKDIKEYIVNKKSITKARSIMKKSLRW